MSPFLSLVRLRTLLIIPLPKGLICLNSSSANRHGSRNQTPKQDCLLDTSYLHPCYHHYPHSSQCAAIILSQGTEAEGFHPSSHCHALRAGRARSRCMPASILGRKSPPPLFAWRRATGWTLVCFQALNTLHGKSHLSPSQQSILIHLRMPVLRDRWQNYSGRKRMHDDEVLSLVYVVL